MKNKYLKYGFIALAILIAGFAVKQFFFQSSESKIVVETTKIATGEINNTITATGTVQPVDEVEVGTQISGLVSKLYVDYNTEVKKGQLLAELDKTNLQEAVSSAKAQYNSAMSELTYNQQNYNRQTNMYRSGVISKAEYEQAAYQFNAAQQNVNQRRTALNQAQTNLSYANIYSPIDGIILSKAVEEGQTVAASLSTPTLFTIAKDLTKMQVEANVDEADIGGVKVGQNAKFSVDAYPKDEFDGIVTEVRLSVTTESNVVTYTVIIETDNSDMKLKPGLTATVSIYKEELKNIPIISASALNFSPDQEVLKSYYQQENITSKIPEGLKNTSKQKYVWVKNSDGSVAQKEVKVGSDDGIHYQIISGLAKTDEVITSLSQQTVTAQSGESSESPFMPKRPGSSIKSTSKTSSAGPPPQ